LISGSIASDTTILAGGTDAVSAGATDFGAQISGGEQDVYGSAIAPLWRQISS
jgi:autotransporter passenger strand-loop-strand repeat protein